MATNNINLQIQKLIDKTVEGKIDWIFISEFEYKWTQQNADRLYVTTLSQTTLSKPIQYMLTIQSINPNQIIMELKNETELNALFYTVSNFSKDNAANIIDTLLESV